MIFIPNGLDLSTIQMKTDWEIKKGYYIYREYMKKGIELLFNAVFSIRAKLNGYKIMIAGEGEPAYVEEIKNVHTPRHRGYY